MLLDMAVKQGETRLVGREIYGSSPEQRNDYSVFYNPRRRLTAMLRNFKRMTM